MATSQLRVVHGPSAGGVAPARRYRAARPESRPHPAWRALRDAVSGIKDNAVVFAVLAPFAAAALLVDAITGVPVAGRLMAVELGGPLSRTLRLAVVLIALSVGWFAARRLRDRRRADRDRRRVARDFDAGVESSDLRVAWSRFPHRPTVRRMIRFFVCMLAYALFLHVFVGFKGAIPIFHPFGSDQLLMRLDRAVHFGHDPWRLVQPVVGHALVTRFLDFLYYAWFPVNLVLVAWFGWMDDTRDRRRFFLAYLLTWVLLGNVVALLFSSVGPCYFALVSGSLGPYAELMTYLRGVNAAHALTALDVQGMLLDAYRAEEVHAIEGIAAMPSLHVAMPFVFAMVTAGKSRLVACCFALFGVLILIGSVHLGWHYAVDGYAAILGAVSIFWIVERLLPRPDARVRRARDARPSISAAPAASR